MVESSYLNDMQSLKSIYKKRKTTVVFTQQPIQPLTTFTSGSQIQLVFQNSRSFLDLSKVQLFFRPVVQFDAENGMTLEQRALLGMTVTDPTQIFTLQSVQINGNQICSQPQSNLQVTRSIFQSYWNALVPAKYNAKLSGSGDIFSGLVYSGGSGSPLYAGVENSVMAPCSGLFVSPGYVSGTNIVEWGATVGTINDSQFNNSSLFEGSPFPRATISPMLSYYMPANFNKTATIIQNNYYGQVMSSFADSELTGAKIPNQLSNLRLPLLAQAITPSIAVYRKQQEALQHTRMRFLCHTTTAFQLPSTADANYSRTLCINQYKGVTKTTNIAGQPATITGTQSTFTGSPPADTTALTPSPGSYDVLSAMGAQCRMKYGMSVQNFQSGQSLGRQPGTKWSSTNFQLLPKESFTQMSVALGDLSCELKDIGLICMENAQVVIQLQVNIPQNCISAYLQPGLICDPYNSLGSDAYLAFLKGCLIGNTTTIAIVDTTLRIEFQEFADDAYPILKQLMYQSKPFTSLRQQYDAIPGSGIFTQRLSIGSSQIIQGLLILFPAFNRNKLLTNASVLRRTAAGSQIYPQDTVISYQGCQPVTDLRSLPQDSYLIQCSQLYCEIDGKRYTSMDLNLSDPALSFYLVTQAGLQTTLGKFLNIDLQEYVLNRFCYFLPINVSGDPSQRIQDQQIVITANIDGSQRVAYSETFNEAVADINNQFGMLTFALTLQSLVECSYVVV